MQVDIKSYTFTNIKVGECFYLLHETTHIKTIFMRITSGDRSNCVNLETGVSVYLNTNTHVVPVKAKVVIE